MSAALADAAVVADKLLPTRDKIIIGLIVFFASIAMTIEAYWLIFNQVMESRTDLFANVLAFYWPADYTYRISGYPLEKSFTLALEGVNTLITQWLSFLLICAIVKSKPYRYPLQLVIATYTFYGTLLYYLVAHISGYAVFAYHGTYPIRDILSSKPAVVCRLCLDQLGRLPRDHAAVPWHIDPRGCGLEGNQDTPTRRSVAWLAVVARRQ